MVLASAACFAAMPIFAKLAYDDGTDPVGLLTIRYAASAAILLPALRLLRGHRADVTGRGPLLLVMVALFGSQSFCFFASVEQNGAVTSVLLLFTYPLLTTLASALLFGEGLGARKLALLALGFLGVVLSIGGFSASFTAVGLLLGIGSSVLFAAAMLVAKRMLARHGDAAEMMAIVYAGCTPAFLVVFAASGASLPAAADGWLALLGGVVLVGTIAAMGLFFAGLDHLPAGTAAMLSTLEPAISVLLAAIFLAEAISFSQAVGVALVVASILALTQGMSESEPVNLEVIP